MKSSRSWNMKLQIIRSHLGDLKFPFLNVEHLAEAQSRFLFHVLNLMRPKYDGFITEDLSSKTCMLFTKRRNFFSYPCHYRRMIISFQRLSFYAMNKIGIL